MSNSDRADNMTNSLKGIRLKDVKNKEFPKGSYVGIFYGPMSVTALVLSQPNSKAK